MYNNLKAELVRIGKNQGYLATILDISEKQISFKFNGVSDFTMSEAIKIKDELFPDQTLDYLFSKTKN